MGNKKTKDTSMVRVATIYVTSCEYCPHQKWWACQLTKTKLTSGHKIDPLCPLETIVAPRNKRPES
jgi:hypothetical protein